MYPLFLCVVLFAGFAVGAVAGGAGGFRFVRKNPGLLLTTLGFLRDEPGLLDFENKRNLLRMLLANPDFATRATLNVMASVSELGVTLSPVITAKLSHINSASLFQKRG